MPSPPVDAPETVVGLLRHVRRRIRLAWTLATAQRWVLAWSGVVLALIVIARAIAWTWLQPAALLVVVVALVVLVIRAAAVPVGFEAAARRADRGLGTHDALSSALQFGTVNGDGDVFGQRIRARATFVAERADARDAVPLRVRWKPFAGALVVFVLAIGLVLLTAPRSATVSASERDRDALAAEADTLRERAEELRGDDAASPDQLTLAQQLDQLADELQQANDLDEGLDALDQVRSELEARIDDTYLAEKSAVQGLNRSLAAQPLGANAGGAAEQLAALGAELDALSDEERQSLAERLAAAAETQAVGNPAAAAALSAAASSLGAGDVSGAAAALGDAADAQRDGELSVELADTQLEQLVSALVIGLDSDGRAIVATGGQFSSDESVSPTTPSSVVAAVPDTTPADIAQGMPDGPLDYVATDRWLPLWPEASASDPPATTTGYGMHRCDSGYGTKILRVDPVTGPSHAYSGTLCVFIDLTEPRPSAVTSCATATDKFNYARCQRRTDQTDTEGPGTAVSTLATPEQQTAMAAFPTATAWDQPEVFTVDVSAATGPESSIDFRDDAVAVTLNPSDTVDGVDSPGACFLVDLPGGTVQGCVGHGLLATGLAYGAFQDGDGPIEIVGIVPDEVTAVEIGGTTLTPTNNVWHYTATPGSTFKVTVRSADGRTAATS